MYLVNIIVVYFAFGVPSGVMTAILLRRRIDLHELVQIVYNLAFWPIFVFQRIYDSSLRRGAPRVEFREPFPSKSSNRLERNNGRRIRTQEAVVNGLQQALKEATSADQIQAPFEGVISHPDPDIAAKCFHRRNIARLEHHLERNVAELNAMLGNSDQLISETGSVIEGRSMQLHTHG